MRYAIWTALLISSLSSLAQSDTAKYWIQFTDKNFNKYSLSTPGEFLTVRAMDRRSRYQIPLTFTDLPVSDFYIDSLRSLGLIIGNRSKWMNAVIVSTHDTNLVNLAGQLSFVKNTENVGRWAMRIPEPEGTSILLSSNWRSGNEYGESLNQIAMVGGDILHQMGYRGEGMVIAVLDAGFLGVDYLPAFERIRNNGQILGTRDFVDGDHGVYHAHTHGMYVLSVMAGHIPGYLIGTAPEASYWLLRSEEGATELIIEEDNWISAAEFADSVGADVINSSLGYSQFDDTTMNHTYADMDGNTTRISIAADIAASKGILVVNSAGNEGNSPWYYILAPADGDSVLAVGAVDSNGAYAQFSSHGPSADGQIKPNIAAQGQQVVITSFAEPYIQRGSGTSFSAPLMAGMAASLWQAFPQKSNMQIIDALQRSASQFENPDDKLGYGIPNMINAHYLLSGSPFDPVEPNSKPIIYPNPFSSDAYLFYYSQFSGVIKLDYFNTLGQLAATECFTLKKLSNHNFRLAGFQLLAKGMYVVSVSVPGTAYNIKVSKF